MARNEYIPTKRVSETIYERHYGRDNKNTESITIYVEYTWNRPYAVDVLFNDCSEACMEYYGDWDIEKFIHIRGEAAQKLASKFSARDEKTLLNRITERFRSFGENAYREIEEWLKQKDIEYTTSIY